MNSRALYRLGNVIVGCTWTLVSFGLILAGIINDAGWPGLIAGFLFAPSRGKVERGRVNVIAPGGDGFYTWWWMRLDPSAKGPGVTTAVVWSP